MNQETPHSYISFCRISLWTGTAAWISTQQLYCELFEGFLGSLMYVLSIKLEGFLIRLMKCYNEMNEMRADTNRE